MLGNCHPAKHPPIDLAEITDSSYLADRKADFTEVVEQGRHMCNSCPILVECRRTALRETDQCGMVAGMLPRERQEWRDRRGMTVAPVSIVDVTPAHELTADFVDDLPGQALSTNQKLPSTLVQLVLRMTSAGLTAEEIVQKLNHPAVQRRTVAHIRNKYGDGDTNG